MSLSPKTLQTLCYLEKVIDIINDYGLGKYIAIDLGMVQKLNYYSGIIFRGYTYGMGFPILSGGRYDRLIDKLGKKCPAVGFGTNINMIMAALSRQKFIFEKPIVNMTIGYNFENRKEAFLTAEEFRKQGKVVECDVTNKTFEELREYANKKGIFS